MVSSIASIPSTIQWAALGSFLSFAITPLACFEWSLSIYCERGVPFACSLECKIKRIHGQMHQEPILQTRAIEVLSLRNHRDNHFFGLERFVSYKEKEKMGDEEWCIRQPNYITIWWLHLNSILQTLQRKRPCRALAKLIHSVHYSLIFTWCGMKSFAILTSSAR